MVSNTVVLAQTVHERTMREVDGALYCGRAWDGEGMSLYCGRAWDGEGMSSSAPRLA